MAEHARRLAGSPRSLLSRMSSPGRARATGCSRPSPGAPAWWWRTTTRPSSCPACARPPGRGCRCAWSWSTPTASCPLRAAAADLPHGLRLPALSPEGAARPSRRPPVGAPARRPPPAAARLPSRGDRRAAGRRPRRSCSRAIRRPSRPCPSTTRCRRSPGSRGGSAAARRALDRFLDERLGRYGEGRNDPAERGDERPIALSPLRPHLAARGLRGRWPGARAGRLSGSARTAGAPSEGWWGMRRRRSRSSTSWSPGASWATTWPRGARTPTATSRCPTGRGDARGARGRPAARSSTRSTTSSAARTHDELWNAAQGQLLARGAHPQLPADAVGQEDPPLVRLAAGALAILIELNNRYALDGRDPNSYSGIFWCLGRYDRPWAPRAAGLRQRALHEHREHAAQIQGRRLRRAADAPGRRTMKIIQR